MNGSHRGQTQSEAGWADVEVRPGHYSVNVCCRVLSDWRAQGSDVLRRKIRLAGEPVKTFDWIERVSGGYAGGAGFADEVGDAGDCYLELVEAGGVAGADVAFAARAEGGAGDYGDAFLAEEADGELLAGEAAAGDAGEDVEGAEWLEAVEAHLVEAVDDEVAAELVLAAHGLDVGGALLEGLDGGILCGAGGAEDAVLVDFHHGVREDGGGAGVADAEAGHGECLGEAVEEDGAVSHTGEGGDGDVRGAIVGDL